ncbi:hypothetical protein RchiOBHm_Chr2g0122481 [Rosa chinensis]|uniref:Uncharacterized protein n=2 Tax=Rosa chinensis TaxID=74649 RepID=A0A2P6RST7_ROSCH|nr:hypothetical protein RchiOBHm_Chr2g0122481 [Rosa chinensis]
MESVFWRTGICRFEMWRRRRLLGAWSWNRVRVIWLDMLLSGNERLPGAVVPARERLLERLRGMSHLETSYMNMNQVR